MIDHFPARGQVPFLFNQLVIRTLVCLTPVLELDCSVNAMARPPLVSDRITRLEKKLDSLIDETNKLTHFCLDISPEYGRRIVTATQEMEMNVIHNVTNFEARMEEINKTVKTLVKDSANDCMAMVQRSLNQRIAGLDGRLIGLNKRHLEIDKELCATIARLDEFSNVVEKTLEEANTKALTSLQEKIEDLVLHAVKANLKCSPTFLRPPFCQSTPTLGMLVEDSSGIGSPVTCQVRGRSRERFSALQQQLVTRARSISSDSELRSVISDAKRLAAAERVSA